MEKKDKSFMGKMFADGTTDTVSHKRVVSITSMIMLIALSLLSAFGFVATTEYIYVFAMLTGGESLLTTVEKTGKMFHSTKTSVRDLDGSKKKPESRPFNRCYDDEEIIDS